MSGAEEYFATLEATMANIDNYCQMLNFQSLLEKFFGDQIAVYQAIIERLLAMTDPAVLVAILVQKIASMIDKLQGGLLMTLAKYAIMIVLLTGNLIALKTKLEDEIGQGKDLIAYCAAQAKGLGNIADLKDKVKSDLMLDDFPLNKDHIAVNKLCYPWGMNK